MKAFFSMFDATLPVTYLPTMEKHFKNVCAILNAFFGPLCTDPPNWREKANLTLRRMSLSNSLELQVRSEDWMSKRANWKNIDEVVLSSFPRLSEEDLKNLTLGSYQIELAAEYSTQHIRKKSPYVIQIHTDATNIIRAKIGSRMSAATNHTAWIEYVPLSTGPDNFRYCCSCKVGARMAGMCSHLCSIFWYLGYARHRNFSPRSYRLADSILNATDMIASRILEEESQP